MYRKNNDFQEAYQESIELFKNRVFKHEKDNLFTYDYSKQKAMELKETFFTKNTTMETNYEIFVIISTKILQYDNLYNKTICDFDT